MARIITKEIALQIAGKLKATVHAKKNRPHDLYVVHYQGTLVASFGIRRGSEKDKGHDFIPPAIHLSPHEAKLFGQCSMTYENWVAKMREKGIIPTEPDPPK